MKNLVSPFDLAEDVIAIDLPENEYDSKTQTRYDVVNPVLAITWGQTQTFDIHGKPKDSDNDK